MTIVCHQPIPPFCMPESLFAYVSRASDVKQALKGDDFERKIYTCLPLDPHEVALLVKFREFQREQGVRLSRSMESRILRYLSHTRGNVPKAMEALIGTQDFRRKFFNPTLKDTDFTDAWKSGFAYFCGRDDGYRPLLVVRAKVLQDHAKDWGVDYVTRVFAFCVEFAIRYLFLPSKVESLIVLLDLKGISMHIPKEQGQKLLEILTHHYVGRLYQLLVVNAPTMVAGLWSVVRRFLSDRQQAKTVFLKRPTDVAKDRFALHQIEVQYGGTVSTLTTFYPFYFANAPFTANFAGTPNLPELELADCWRAITRSTTIGVLAEEDVHPDELQLQYGSAAIEIFKKLGLKPPNIMRRIRTRSSFQSGYYDDDDDIAAMSSGVRKSSRVDRASKLSKFRAAEGFDARTSGGAPRTSSRDMAPTSSDSYADQAGRGLSNPGVVDAEIPGSRDTLVPGSEVVGRQSERTEPLGPRPEVVGRQSKGAEPFGPRSEVVGRQSEGAEARGSRSEVVGRQSEGAEARGSRSEVVGPRSGVLSSPSSEVLGAREFIQPGRSVSINTSQGSEVMARGEGADAGVSFMTAQSKPEQPPLKEKNGDANSPETDRTSAHSLNLSEVGQLPRFFGYPDGYNDISSEPSCESYCSERDITEEENQAALHRVKTAARKNSTLRGWLSVMFACCAAPPLSTEGGNEVLLLGRMSKPEGVEVGFVERGGPDANGSSAHGAVCCAGARPNSG